MNILIIISSMFLFGFYNEPKKETPVLMLIMEHPVGDTLNVNIRGKIRPIVFYHWIDDSTALAQNISFGNSIDTFYLRNYNYYYTAICD